MTQERVIARGGDRNLIWLASYPKSGNTWLRAMLTAVLSDDAGVDLANLIGDTSHAMREPLDDAAGISSAEMSVDELIGYQAQLYQDMARGADERLFLKTHSAWLKDGDGTALFPTDACAGAIYCVRNPIDIVPSYAHHEGKGFDRIIAMMADSGMTLNHWDDRTSSALPQLMRSWSEHVRSWLEHCDFPLLPVRYEDMLADPHAELSRILEFCAMDRSPKIIASAVEATQFHRLKHLETRTGFAEKPSQSRAFFRSGRIGGGAAHLSPDQITSVLADHGDMMRTLGYPSLFSHYAKDSSNA